MQEYQPTGDNPMGGGPRQAPGAHISVGNMKIGINTLYIKTLFGILRIATVVGSLITFIFSCFGSPFAAFVSFFSLLSGLGFLALHLLFIFENRPISFRWDFLTSIFTCENCGGVQRGLVGWVLLEALEWALLVLLYLGAFLGSFVLAIIDGGVTWLTAFLCAGMLGLYIFQLVRLMLDLRAQGQNVYTSDRFRGPPGGHVITQQDRDSWGSAGRRSTEVPMESAFEHESGIGEGSSGEGQEEKGYERLPGSMGGGARQSSGEEYQQGQSGRGNVGLVLQTPTFGRVPVVHT